MAVNAFTDMLAPGETVLAELAGEGRRIETAQGMERTWWHVALTRERLLVVRMRGAPGVDRWDLVGRVAASRGNLRFSHFARTDADTARLTIEGVGEPIVFIDVDRPALVGHVQTFLGAWGGPVRGGESLAVVDRDAENDNSADTKKILIAVGVLLAVFFACCGCLGVGGVVRQLLGFGLELG
jgi:hypothetical protein